MGARDWTPPSVVAVGFGKLAAAKVPLMPLAGTDVAAMVPVPDAESVAPLPTTNAPDVFVPEVRVDQAEEPLPPDPVPQGEPASTTFPFASHLAQLPLTPVAVPLTVLLPVPVKLSAA